MKVLTSITHTHQGLGDPTRDVLRLWMEHESQPMLTFLVTSGTWIGGRTTSLRHRVQQRKIRCSQTTSRIRLEASPSNPWASESQQKLTSPPSHQSYSQRQPVDSEHPCFLEAPSLL